LSKKYRALEMSRIHILGWARWSETDEYPRGAVI